MATVCNQFSASVRRRIRRERSLLAGATMVALAIWSGDPQLARGQGLAISGIGAVNLSMAGAATAAPIDAAGALHWNPATISGLWSSEVSFGVGMVLPTEEVRSSLAFPALSGADRGEPGASPLPHVAWVEKHEGSRWTRGIGVFGIGGFRSNYSSSLTNPVLTPPPPIGVGVGRVFAEAELLQIVPTVAYALSDRVSVGLAPTITMANLTVDPLLLGVPDDANGDGTPSYPSGRGNRLLWGGGFQLGVYYIGEGNWNWGAAVKSPQWFEKGRFKTEDELGRPRTVTLDFDYPLILSVGTAYKGFERWLMACDVRYFDYGQTNGFKQQGFDAGGALTGLGWTSIFAVSAGTQYEVTECLHARIGYSHNQNPISGVNTGFNVASPVISQDFIYLGSSYQFSSRSTLSLTYTHAFENESSGPIQTPLGAIPGSNVTSIVSLDAISVGMSVRY